MNFDEYAAHRACGTIFPNDSVTSAEICDVISKADDVRILYDILDIRGWYRPKEEMPPELLPEVKHVCMIVSHPKVDVNLLTKIAIGYPHDIVYAMLALHHLVTPKLIRDWIIKSRAAAMSNSLHARLLLDNPTSINKNWFSIEKVLTNIHKSSSFVNPSDQTALSDLIQEWTSTGTTLLPMKKNWINDWTQMYATFGTKTTSTTLPPNSQTTPATLVGYDAAKEEKCQKKLMNSGI